MSNGDGTAAWAYHNRTKHSVASVRANPHFLDFENQPLPFKVYKGVDPIALPHDLPPIAARALDAITVIETGPAEPLVPDLLTLTQLLHYSMGITKRKRHPGGEIYFRAAACTGALYHIDGYVVCGDLDELGAGVYHFGPHDRSLGCLRQGDYRSVVVRACGGEPAVARAPIVLILASTYWRNSWKYQSRAYRHCFWDCGTIIAHLLAVAAGRGIPARVVTGFVDDIINRLLGLDAGREGVMALVPLGWSDSPAAERHGDIDTLDPLRFETVPLSRSEIDYPAIRELHEASSLPTPDAVAAWRTGACPRPAEIVRDAVPLQPLDAEDVPGDAIDRGIHRRSSTRTFGRTALSYGSFSTILDRATRGVPMDCLGPPGTMLNEIYVIANAVEGLMPGTYVYRRDELALAPLSQGDFRRDAAHLGLGQALPGDASADIFSLVNLGPVLERYGDRGYRVAELEAGIIGGKLYLAAYAQRLGATGLTFFDDDVTEFFSPHASGKSVMFLVALGVSARRAPR